MKTLQNNFTTPEQSKRLLELGVPADSADCYFLSTDGITTWVRGVADKNMNWFGTIDKTPIPCWSVGRLMEIFDICFSIKEEDWPTTSAMTKTGGSVIEYLVTTFEIQPPCKLDFSKLED